MNNEESDAAGLYHNPIHKNSETCCGLVRTDSEIYKNMRKVCELVLEAESTDPGCEHTEHMFNLLIEAADLARKVIKEK